jgi:hypothetical protein
MLMSVIDLELNKTVHPKLFPRERHHSGSGILLKSMAGGKESISREGAKALSTFERSSDACAKVRANAPSPRR